MAASMFGNDQPGIQAIPQYPGQLDAHRKGSFANAQEPHTPKICQVIFTPGNIQNIAGAADKAFHCRARFHGVDGSGKDAGDRFTFPGEAQTGSMERLGRKHVPMIALKYVQTQSFRHPSHPGKRP